MTGENEGIGLAAALGAVRRELAQAMAEADAEAGPVRLSVSSLELELQTTLSMTGGIDGGVRVQVISLGAKREQGRSDVQTLRIQLDARTATGGNVQTNDTLSSLPR